MELDDVSQLMMYRKQINFNIKKISNFFTEIFQTLSICEYCRQISEWSVSVRLGYYGLCFGNLDGLTILIHCVVG